MAIKKSKGQWKIENDGKKFKMTVKTQNYNTNYKWQFKNSKWW